LIGKEGPVSLRLNSRHTTGHCVVTAVHFIGPESAQLNVLARRTVCLAQRRCGPSITHRYSASSRNRTATISYL